VPRWRITGDTFSVLISHVTITWDTILTEGYGWGAFVLEYDWLESWLLWLLDCRSWLEYSISMYERTCCCCCSVTRVRYVISSAWRHNESSKLSLHSTTRQRLHLGLTSRSRAEVNFIISSRTDANDTENDDNVGIGYLYLCRGGLRNVRVFWNRVRWVRNGRSSSSKVVLTRSLYLLQARPMIAPQSSVAMALKLG